MLDRIFALIMPQTLHSGTFPKHLIPILIFAYSCLLPREFTVEIQGAALFPYRLTLILMLPFAIARLAKYPVRPSLIDACVGFASIWFIVSLIYTTSYEAGLISGTSYAIDYGLAYLLGRASIRSPEDLRQLFRYFLPGILGLVVLLAAESISHKMLLRPQLATLLGAPDPYIYYDIRFGLLRAMGPFPHPILGGVFLAGTLPLAWYLSHTVRLRMVGCAAALGAIFTVSSTAIIGLVLSGGIIAMNIVQRKMKLPIFPIATLYIGLMLLTISLGSENGLVNFAIRNLTFEAGSGYYRQLIWEYGGAEALANPLFGIGLRDWARPEYMSSETVDAYWLVIAMLNGFPALAATALAMLGAIIAILRTQRFRHSADADAAKSIVLLLVIAAVSGLTVHFWEAINSWIALIMGCGVSLASQARSVPAPFWHTPRPAMQSFDIQRAPAE